MTYTAHPLRRQRRRTKGFRLPPATCCVTRPGKWGNPFDTADEFEGAFEMFSQSQEIPDWMDRRKGEQMIDIVANVRQLRGFKLACWCELDQPCHADTLAREANK